MNNLQSLSNTRIPTGAIVLLALLVSSCAPKDDAAKAEAEVNRFHKNWNLWEFAAVYNDAHKGFRTLQRPEKLIATLQAVRKTDGEFKSAKQRSVNVSFDHLDKDITLKYDCVYEHTSAVETFSYRMTGDKPLLLNYYLMSAEEDVKHEAELAARRRKMAADRSSKK